MTNLEWIKSLTDEQFALLFSNILPVEFINKDFFPQPFHFGISLITRRGTNSYYELMRWFRAPQELEVWNGKSSREYRTETMPATTEGE